MRESNYQSKPMPVSDHQIDYLINYLERKGRLYTHLLSNLILFPVDASHPPEVH